LVTACLAPGWFFLDGIISHRFLRAGNLFDAVTEVTKDLASTARLKDASKAALGA